MVWLLVEGEASHWCCFDQQFPFVEIQYLLQSFLNLQENSFRGDQVEILF